MSPRHLLASTIRLPLLLVRVVWLYDLDHVGRGPVGALDTRGGSAVRPSREGVVVDLFVDSLVEREYGYTQDWLYEVLLHWYLVGVPSTR